MSIRHDVVSSLRAALLMVVGISFVGCGNCVGSTDGGTDDDDLNLTDNVMTDFTDTDIIDESDFPDPEDAGPGDGDGDDDDGGMVEPDADIDDDPIDYECDQYDTRADCVEAPGCDPILATPYVTVLDGACLSESNADTVMLGCVQDRCVVEDNWCDSSDNDKPYYVVGCPTTGVLGCTVAEPSLGCDFDGGIPVEDAGMTGPDGGMLVDGGTDGGVVIPKTIYDLKQGLIGEVQPISLTDMIVTAVHPTGFFSQLSSDSEDFDTEEFSCTWTATGTPPTVNEGETISFTGLSAETGGQWHLTMPTAIMLDQAAGAQLPQEKIMVPSVYGPEVALGAASGFEGCLVKVQNVLVTDAAVDPGPSYDGEIEFEIEMGLHLSDFFTNVAPIPQNGYEVLFATGPLMYRNNHLKLMWRSQADILITP